MSQSSDSSGKFHKSIFGKMLSEEHTFPLLATVVIKITNKTFLNQKNFSETFFASVFQETLNTLRNPPLKILFDIFSWPILSLASPYKTETLNFNIEMLSVT